MLSLSQLLGALERASGPLPADTPIYQAGIQPVPRWEGRPPRPYVELGRDPSTGTWRAVYVYGNLGADGVTVDDRGRIVSRMVS